MLLLSFIGVGIGSLHTMVEETIYSIAQLRLDHVNTIEHFFSAHLFTSLPLNYFIYCAILGAGLAVSYYRRDRAQTHRVMHLERQLLQSKLDALQAQLHPHFLFNALNAISALVERDPNATRQMIARVSDLLRLSLDHQDKHEIPLGQELTFIRHYIAIEQLRHQDRLKLEWDIHPNLEQALVPNMILQPLVENAIRHGIDQRLSGGAIKISALQEDGRLILKVEDDGPGLQSDEVSSDERGVGLRNTQARLEQLYGDQSVFDLFHTNGEGVQVCLTIPYHTTSIVEAV